MQLPNLPTNIPGDILVIGAGNWGTTLARLMAPNRRTRLWTETEQDSININKDRENKQFMPGIKLPDELIVEPFGASEIGKDDLVLIVVPSSQVRNVAIAVKEKLNGQIVVNCSKGFEHSTMKTLSQVLEEHVGDSPIVVWSGPNIAREIAEGKPTRAVLACRDMAVLAKASRMLKSDLITFEISRDVRGVEMVASLKGIIAITIGLADGLELGDNFVGLVLSYALREFVAIAEFMEIPSHTIYGIAGLGDCVTSSLSPHGRNRRFGYLMAQGTPPKEAIKQVGMVVEGVAMMQTITELEDLNIPVPICSIIKKIIFEPNGDVRDLLIDTVMHYRT